MSDGLTEMYAEEYQGYPHVTKHQASPLSTQVDGNHYMMLKIQPIEFILANNLGFLEGNVVKYVSRYKNKNGVSDLKKAKHYLEILINSLEQKSE